MRLILAFTVLSNLFSARLLAQDSVTVIPGPEYEAGLLHRMVFGSGWRDLWTTPVKVAVLDLSSFARGMRVTSAAPEWLRFRGGNGKEYRFRPLKKDPQLVLPRAVQKTFVDSIVHDFIATTNPVSDLVAAPLLDAVGAASSSVRLVQLGDDERLEEYRDEFKDRVGLLEEDPAEELPPIDIHLLSIRLLEENEQVDAREYLKARLMDVFLGDWDSESEGHLIPRDRDQALSRYNGFFGWLMAQRIPEIESFSNSYPWISDLTWSGRYLDRRFLAELDRSDWESVTNAIHAALTDDVIEAAVRELPPEMYEKEGANLLRTLLSRRDQFKQASEEYYENLACFVDIHASNANEYADVERLGSDTVIVSLYKRDRNTGGANGKPFFVRTFDRRETREIRLYLHGGEDFTVVRGNAMKSIPVRIIGGEGDDELADSSQVRHKLFGLLEVPKTSTYFYENDRKAEFIYGPSTRVLADELPGADSMKYEMELPYRDWGHAWKGFPWLGLNSDDGLFLGGIARLTNYGFRATPYRDEATFRLGYAFGPGRFRTAVDHAFPNIYTGTVNVHAHASGLEAVNFFGLGNNTSYSKALAAKDIYEVRQMQYALLPGYSIDLVKNVTIGGHIGLRLITNDMEGLRDSALLGIAAPYGVEDALYSSLGISGTFDTRDNIPAPQHGVYFTLGTRWNPEIFDNAYAYTKAYTEFRGFYTAPVLGGITLAVRARGEKIFGNRFPFYDAAFLGGISDLRGYARERFAGDAAVLATAELRVNIGNFSVLVPGMFGIHGFAEEGRVFYDGETSEARHGSFGGGIWLAPQEIRNTVALTFAKSPEQLTFAITGGFAF